MEMRFRFSIKKIICIIFQTGIVGTISLFAILDILDPSF